MAYRADMAAVNVLGEPTLAIEVRSKQKTSAAWAGQMRRNLLAHGVVAGAKFFLLALPDRFYLWKGAGNDLSELPPTYVIDPTDLLAPYFARADVSPGAIGERGFELIVGAWLQDLLEKEQLPDDLKREHPWIVESGLYDALKGGRVLYEVAA